MINQVALVGRAYSHSEYETKNGTFHSFSLLVSIPVRDDENPDAELTFDDMWYRCSYFESNRYEQLFGSMVKKGSRILVVGNYVVEKYDDEEGNERQSHKIKVRDWELCVKKRRGQKEDGSSTRKSRVPAGKQEKSGAKRALFK